MSEWHSKPITSTGFDSQMCGEDGYEIHFYTDKKEAYLAVQDVCRQFIDRKPLRNADRIRAMSDEELAGWLERIRLCCTTDLCGRSCPFAEVCYSNAEAPKETLDWLKQEAE